MRKSYFRKEYVIYKGEDFVFSGNSEEVSKYLGIKRKSLTHKVWRSKKSPKGERYTVITLELD